MVAKIKPDESEIRCEWILKDGRCQETENCSRIRDLIGHYLHRLALDKSGWEKLFVDPADDRLWELTHPISEMHAGGPAVLRVVSADYVRQKYGITR